MAFDLLFSDSKLAMCLSQLCCLKSPAYRSGGTVSGSVPPSLWSSLAQERENEHQSNKDRTRPSLQRAKCGPTVLKGLQGKIIIYSHPNGQVD